MKKHKVVVVSGGSRGIGLEICKKCASNGFSVVALSRSPQIESISKKLPITSDSQRHFGFICDLKNLQQIETTVANIESEVGDIFGLINNAGVLPKDNLLLRMKADELDEAFSVNVKGTTWLTKTILKTMLKSKDSVVRKIITIGSIVGLEGNTGQTAYATSKAALVGFTKTLAKEVGARGVTVNLIAPGYISTEMIQQLPDQLKEKIKNKVLLKRLGTPEDVADAVGYLLQADYVTGQVIRVDGGLSLCSIVD